MSPYNVGMYIAKIPNRGSPPTYLLRQSFRRNGKVRTRTLANLSALPLDQIKCISRVLKGERLVPVEQSFRITRRYPTGMCRQCWSHSGGWDWKR